MKVERTKICSRCGEPNDRLPQRYCRACHAANMRKTRPGHSDLSETEQAKRKCRVATNNLIRSGEIKKQACAKCGSPESQVHHLDYLDPRNVQWLCFPCHRRLHIDQRPPRPDVRGLPGIGFFQGLYYAPSVEELAANPPFTALEGEK